jgi:hypothetical protein
MRYLAGLCPFHGSRRDFVEETFGVSKTPEVCLEPGIRDNPAANFSMSTRKTERWKNPKTLKYIEMTGFRYGKMDKVQFRTR